MFCITELESLPPPGPSDSGTTVGIPVFSLSNEGPGIWLELMIFSLDRKTPINSKSWVRKTTQTVESKRRPKEWNSSAAPALSAFNTEVSRNYPSPHLLEAKDAGSYTGHF